MNASSTQILITGAIQDYGAALLVILGAVLTVGVGYLVYRVGWGRLMEFVYDGGFGQSVRYMGKPPWRGYKRFRSFRWNLDNTAK